MVHLDFRSLLLVNNKGANKFNRDDRTQELSAVIWAICATMLGENTVINPMKKTPL